MIGPWTLSSSQYLWLITLLSEICEEALCLYDGVSVVLGQSPQRNCAGFRCSVFVPFSDCLAPMRHTQCASNTLTGSLDVLVHSKYEAQPNAQNRGKHRGLCPTVSSGHERRNASCTYSTSLHLLSWTFFCTKTLWSQLHVPSRSDLQPLRLFPVGKSPSWCRGVAVRCRAYLPTGRQWKVTEEQRAEQHWAFTQQGWFKPRPQGRIQNMTHFLAALW